MNKYLAATVVAGALALTGCSAAYTESGTVTSKEVDLECSKPKTATTAKSKGPAKSGATKAPNCHTEYEIDLTRADGSTVEVKANSREDFDACAIGARFPACVSRSGAVKGGQ